MKKLAKFIKSEGNEKRYLGGFNPIFAHGKMCFPIFSHGEKSIWKERKMNTFPFFSIYFFPVGKNGKTHIFPWAKMGLDPLPAISYHNFHKLALYISFHTPQWFGEVARLHSYLALPQVLNLIFLKLSEYRPPPKIL